MKTKYAPSILQEDDCCYLCGRRDRKLDRHEVFPGSYRQKCKEDGLWVLLCHVPCHEGRDGAQYNHVIRRKLAEIAQRRAMETYGWDTAMFRSRYGKNFL